MNTISFKRLITALGVFFSLGAVLFFYYFFSPTEVPNLFVKCSFNQLTGLYCPGCGGQRSLHDLLQFNFLGALHNNAFFIISLPYLVYYFLRFTKSWIYKTPFREKHHTFIPEKWIFILVVLFLLLRNIPFYPFNLLAPMP